MKLIVDILTVVTENETEEKFIRKAFPKTNSMLPAFTDNPNVFYFSGHDVPKIMDILTSKKVKIRRIENGEE